MAHESSPGTTLAPYTAPSWGDAELSRGVYMQVVRGGVALERLSLEREKAKEAFAVFGRGNCEVVCAHASVSRFHAVVQFGLRDGEDQRLQTDTASSVFIYDLGSRHGTRVNRKPVPARQYVPLFDGDHVAFGESSRTYIVEGGPSRRPRHIVAEREGHASSNPSLAGSGAAEDNDRAHGPAEPAPPAQSASQSKRKRDTTAAMAEKRDRLQRDADILRSKETIAPLSAGQQKQLDSLEQRIEELSDRLEEAADGSDGEDEAERASRLERLKSIAASAELTREEVDDRTASTSNCDAASVSTASVVETYESVSKKLAHHEVELARLEAVLAAAVSKARGVLDTTSANAASGDPLDAFMADNDRGLVASEVSVALTRVKHARRERDRLLELKRAAAPSQPTALLSDTP